MLRLFTTQFGKIIILKCDLLRLFDSKKFKRMKLNYKNYKEEDLKIKDQTFPFCLNRSRDRPKMVLKRSEDQGPKQHITQTTLPP